MIRDDQLFKGPLIKILIALRNSSPSQWSICTCMWNPPPPPADTRCWPNFGSLLGRLRPTLTVNQHLVMSCICWGSHLCTCYHYQLAPCERLSAGWILRRWTSIQSTLCGRVLLDVWHSEVSYKRMLTMPRYWRRNNYKLTVFQLISLNGNYNTCIPCHQRGFFRTWPDRQTDRRTLLEHYR